MGLEPVDDAGLKAIVVPLDGSGGSMLTVDLAGPSARMLAGWIRRNDRVWFFKMSGAAGLVASEKSKFAKFLQSVQFPTP